MNWNRVFGFDRQVDPKTRAKQKARKWAKETLVEFFIVVLILLVFWGYNRLKDRFGEDESISLVTDATTAQTAATVADDTDTDEADEPAVTAIVIGEPTGGAETSAATSVAQTELSTTPLEQGIAEALTVDLDTADVIVILNNNEPYFTDDELSIEGFQTFSELDSLGRCGTATACLYYDMMPTEERDESLSSVTPSGWNSYKADNVDGGWLYNRCHLIGYQLTGENANPLNLITGTRQLNVDGMLVYENEVADYIETYHNHFMYRVTPVYDGDNLVANGVIMEGFSVEDNGSGLSFCVFVPNTQHGWVIDYADGTAVEVD